VSAKRDDIDKIRGLGLGADDYIVKPFSPSELVARVVAHINRYERLTTMPAQDLNVIEIGTLKIDKTARRVYVNGNEVVFTNKEFDLLACLAESPDTIFSKEELFEKIWKYDSMGETSTITVHVNRIRDKLFAEDKNFEYINTVWGRGYRFNK
jgi:DNA-binding response OmpR family regulator